MARGARAGGDRDGLSHFLLGFLASEPGVRAGGGDVEGYGGAGVRGWAEASTHPPPRPRGEWGWGTAGRAGLGGVGLLWGGRESGGGVYSGVWV